MSEESRLDRSVTLTLNASGAASATFGPGRSSEHWAVERMTTAGNSAIQPTLNVYRGTSALVDTTRHGNQDISDTNLSLMPGEFITAAYSAGSPGAVMVFYLEGTATYGV